MQVLHVISSLATADGHAVFCLRLAEQLAARGIGQRILTLPSPDGDALPDPMGLVHVAGGRRVQVLNICLPFGLRRQFSTFIASFKPDLVHLHGGWHPFLYLCARLARRRGLPLVLTLHGSLRPVVVEGDRRLKKRLAWRLYQRRLVELADLVHVASETEKADLDRLGFDKDVVVIPNGVDADLYAREAAPPRSQHDADSERVRTVLYLGRLHPLKGLDLLLEAWASLRSLNGRETGDGEREFLTQRRRGAEAQRREAGTWRLVLAGPDEQGTLAGLEKQAERLGLAIARRGAEEGRVAQKGVIVYAGALYGAAKVGALQAADLVVLPSRSENFGMVVAEALAAGVPVITTRGTPWSELQGNWDRSQVLNFSTSRCGWWVEAGAGPLAQALREAMTLSDAERRAMGENGHRLVRTKYRWETVAERMSEAYGRVSGES